MLPEKYFPNDPWDIPRIIRMITQKSKGGDRMKESEIVRRLRARAPDAIEHLLRHLGPLMRYIIAPILPDAGEAEECLSEAAMRVWEKIDRYDPEKSAFTTWLTALTRNLAVDRARRKKPVEEIPEDIPSDAPTPEERVLRMEEAEALRRALGMLGRRDAELVYRKYYYMQTMAQIASELGMTERAVEGRLYRIRTKLRKMLGGEEDE